MKKDHEKLEPNPAHTAGAELDAALVIHLDGPYILESTSVLDNPGPGIWTTVPGTSPVTLPVSSADNRYFRAVHR